MSNPTTACPQLFNRQIMRIFTPHLGHSWKDKQLSTSPGALLTLHPTIAQPQFLRFHCKPEHTTNFVMQRRCHTQQRRVLACSITKSHTFSPHIWALLKRSTAQHFTWGCADTAPHNCAASVLALSKQTCTHNKLCVVGSSIIEEHTFPPHVLTIQKNPQISTSHMGFC